MAALGWLLNLDFAAGTAAVPATGITGGSPDVHAIRRRAWDRIEARAGKVTDEDLNVVLQAYEDEELLAIIRAFLRKV